MDITSGRSLEAFLLQVFTELKCTDKGGKLLRIFRVKKSYYLYKKKEAMINGNQIYRKGKHCQMIKPYISNLQGIVL